MTRRRPFPPARLALPCLGGLLSVLVPLATSGQPSPGAPPAAVADVPACPPDLEVLVERRLAERRGISARDTVAVRPSPEATPCAAAVAGIFVPRGDPARLARERPRVLFHLPHLSRLADRAREVDRLSVRLRPGVEPAVAARSLSTLLPGARVLPTREVAEVSSTTFEVVRRFHRAIGLITLTAGGVFLACIMILKVQERRTHVAALRLMGVSRRTLLGWLLAEASLVALLGGALGIGIGRLAVSVINRTYRSIYETDLLFALLTGETVWTASGLALALGIGAGGVAGIHLLSLDPLAEVGR